MLQLLNVYKGYGTGSNRVEVLENINLHVEEGEFVSIVGFTGSGKTTLINLINGLLMPDRGQVLLNGKPIEGPGPDRGVVFQNYSLLPWLTSGENVLMAVKEVFPDWSKSQYRSHLEKYMEMVNLSHAINKYPAELSGGMRQRVSVARALAMQPQILLMDEPLSALDALTRGSIQKEIDHIREAEKKTIVMITNDVDEGILLSDRIIPLNPGPNAKLGPAFDINIERPRDKVAMNSNPDFIRIRNEVTKYLLDAGAESGKASKGKYELPDLEPIDLRVGSKVFSFS
ncbi:ABC transporter ATP-binding protein [Cytophagaceae bacterium ABcell3]|nr:ABC transporter ATP-binding protein [Cytophagaceae bacterium ABcell3]